MTNPDIGSRLLGNATAVTLATCKTKYSACLKGLYNPDLQPRVGPQKFCLNAQQDILHSHACCVAELHALCNKQGSSACLDVVNCRFRNLICIQFQQLQLLLICHSFDNCHSSGSPYLQTCTCCRDLDNQTAETVGLQPCMQASNSNEGLLHSALCLAQQDLQQGRIV